MRARKGDFFPDEEIARRKKGPVRKPFGADDNREARPSGEGEERKTFRPRNPDDKPRKSFGNREGGASFKGPRKDDGPRKRYDDRGPKKEFRGPRRDDDTRGADKPYRKSPQQEDRPRRSYTDRDDRTSGREEAAGKPFARRDDRPSRSTSGRSNDRPPRRDSRPAKRFGADEQREAGFKRMDRNVKHAGERQFRKPAGERPQRKSTTRTASGESTRLNKYIANTGLCSRREADELIEAGVISVNGKVITELGTRIQPGDDVRYNGAPLRTERLVYVLLNKPKDFITTTDDPEERRTVMSLVEDACRERIYPVGRLDRNTTGLLLLTNDGELTKKLTHPSYKIKKVYHVELDRNLTAADMNAIAAGVELEDGPMQVDEIAYASPDDKRQVGIEIHSGKNRIVRRIFEDMGYQVKKLDRTVFAGLTKKDLPRGRWRMLTEMEVNALKMITGSRKGRD